MTMETYQWQRTHETSPRLTTSIIRSLPKGNWMVRADDWAGPELPAHYDTLQQAMDAADAAARKEQSHDCKAAGCTEWVPVPPSPEAGKSA
jgi:hypothetical protein